MGAAELHQVLQDGKFTSQFLTQKKWIDSGFFQLPFPLQTPPGVVRALAGSDWSLTFFLKIQCSFPRLPALPGIDPSPVWRQPQHSRVSPHSPEGYTATPCSNSLQKAPGWDFMWNCLGRTDLRGGFNFDQPRTTSTRIFWSNYIKFIWLHGATGYKHGRKEYSDFVNVSKTFPLSLWEICMPMKYRINLPQSLTYKDFMFMLRLMFSMLQCSKQKSGVELSCKIIDFDTTTS